MVDSRVRRVICVETDSERSDRDIGDVFNKHGDVLRVWPLTSARDTPRRRCFVEFRDVAAATRSAELRTTNMTVIQLHDKPDLVEHFISVSQHADSDVQPPGSSAPRSGNGANDGFHNLPARPNIRTNGFDPSPAHSSLPRTIPSGMSTFLNALKFAEISLRSPAPASDAMQVDDMPPPPFGGASRAPLSLTPATNSTNSAQSGGFQAKIVMSLCGERISYDLAALEDDPQAIISLLKMTGSERDKWMIVGAHYRRTSLFSSAVAVVTNMVEVFTRNGIHEADLKPAFLFLSGCQTDLAKRHRKPDGAETDTSLAHIKESQRLLQKVLSMERPDLPSKGNGILPPPRRPSPIVTDLPHVPNDPTPTPTTATRPHDLKRQRTEDRVARIAFDPQVPIMQREIQSLRDKNSHLARLMRNGQDAEDRLAKELANERSVRRKLQDRLDVAEAALADSKRVERLSNERMRREFDGRIRAEEKVLEEVKKREDETRRREEAEETLKKRAARPLLDDLAMMLQQASAGGGVNFMGMAPLAGSSSQSQMQ